MNKPMVFLSRHSWKPGMDGVLFHFPIGEEAIYRAKDGTPYKVIVKSDLMGHKDAPEGQYVRELYFFDSPDGAGTWAQNASQLEPIVKEG